MSADIASELPLGVPAPLHRERYDSTPNLQATMSESSEIDSELRIPSPWRHRIANLAIQGFILGTATLSSVAAVEYAPDAAPNLPGQFGAAHLDIAGRNVTVKPKLGQNFSSLDGVLLRKDHKVVPILNKDVGVDLYVDPNDLNFKDKTDRAALGQLGDDPMPEIARIRDITVENALSNGGAGFLLALGAGEFGAFLYRRWRGAYPDGIKDLPEQQQNLLRPVRAAGIGMAVLLAATAGTAGAQALHTENQRTVVGNPMFYGKSLDGTEITGAAEQAAPYIRALLSADNSEFTSTASHDIAQLVESRPDLVNSENEVTFVSIDDLQFNEPMARLWGELSNHVKANFMVTTGDVFQFATPSETYILNTPSYYSGGLPIYMSPGLHDPNDILKYARRAGWHLDENEIIEQDGLKFVLVPTPTVSDVGTFGSGDSLRDPAVSEEQALADTLELVNKEQPDFVFTHESSTGKQIAATGDVKMAVIDGRSYDEIGAQKVANEQGGESNEYTQGSGGGYSNTEANPGAITGPATMTIFKYDKTSGQLYYSVVTVNPNGTPKATKLININVPYADYLKTGRTEPKDLVTYSVPYSANGKNKNIVGGKASTK